MKVVSTSEMGHLDQKAEKELFLSNEILMENAGGSVACLVSQFLGSVEDKSIVGVIGSGNNGGDGLCALRKLFSVGAKARAVLLGDPSKLKGAAALQYRIAQSCQLPIQIVDETHLQILQKDLNNCDLVIDAILGTGLTKQVREYQQKVIKLINHSNKPVISIDIPSDLTEGINGNTGKVLGTAIQASATVTMGLPKYGNVLFPGFGHGGKLYVSSLSYPPWFCSGPEFLVGTSDPKTLPPLPERDLAGHKSSFGVGLFIAGSKSYYGAPYYSSYSFMKCGGGYAHLAAPKGHIPVLANAARETSGGEISGENSEALMELAGKSDIVVMGPGMSTEENLKKRMRDWSEQITSPLLVDGDGLTALAEDLSVLKRRKGPTILTPHPGEMSRLIQKSPSEISENPIELLQEFCRTHSVYTVLKGAHSLVGLPDGKVFFNLSGNDGMGTAGSGDVLCGVIAACIAQGRDIADGVRKGVFLHGMAGDLAAEKVGKDGMTAQTILEYLPEAFLRERKKEYLPSRISYLNC